MAGAQGLFSGIFSVEAHASADGSQIINFQADMPFRYRKQVLDRNTVLLRLYNARLAQNLVTPEGGVNLLAGGVVKSAYIKISNVAGDGSQELVLMGPGLGSRTLRVVGGEELPSQPQVSTSPHVMMARVSHGSHAGQQKTSTQKKKAGANFTNLQTLAANGRIQDDNHAGAQGAAIAYPAIVEAPRIEPEARENPSAVLKLTPGPKIAEIGNVPVASEENVTDRRDSMTPVDGAPSRVYDGDSTSTVMSPIPRYRGGAKPIEAMTTDNQGHPILIKPKNDPIPEFSLRNGGDGGYNALFQAETTDLHQRIGLYLSDALAAYKANQFVQAQKQVEKALMLDASNPDLLAALAEIQVKQGQTALAEQNYQKAQERSLEKYGSRYWG